MLILLPPSEGKSAERGKGTIREYAPALSDDTEGVLRKLNRLKAAERIKWYGVRDSKKAAEVHALNRAALDAPCLKAIERYTGVVYTHLGYPTLTQKRAAHRRICIVSALWGLIPADTPIPNYKLPINPWLAKYWLPINTERIVRAAKGKPVLNLLPQAFRKALPTEGLIDLDFRVQGGKKSAGHFGKAIKGRFVRWLIEENVDQVKDFDGFHEDGCQFNGSDFVQA